MSQMYSAAFENVTVSAAQDLFQLLSGSARSSVIHEVQLSSALTADERARVIFHFGTTNGSGGSTPTVVPLSPNFAAATTVVEANNTTQATNGTTMHAWQWSLLVPFHYLPTPECRIIVPASDLFHISVESAPTSGAMSGYIVWEEV